MQELEYELNNDENLYDVLDAEQKRGHKLHKKLASVLYLAEMGLLEKENEDYELI